MDALRTQGVNVLDLSGRAERAYERAIGHLTKALEVDPRRRSVYDEMMQIYALKGEYEDALITLDQMYRFFPEDPYLWLYLGLGQYRLGQMEVADRAFTTAFEFMDAELEAAYHNLGLFLTREEKQIEAADTIAYRSRYWTSQDPRYLTPYNERKLEHYFRLTYADLLYGSRRLNLRDGRRSVARFSLGTDLRPVMSYCIRSRTGSFRRVRRSWGRSLILSLLPQIQRPEKCPWN